MENQLPNEFNLKYVLKYISVSGKQWEYLSMGNGRITFLILPGGGQYAQSQFMMVDEFADKYKVIVPTITNAKSLNECHEAINKILEKENSDKIIIYGLSIGALIAQSYTKRNINRVLALIISHGCTPTSKTYKKKVIIPLVLLSIALPLIPSFFVKFFAKNLAGKIQGISTKITKNFNNQTLSEKDTKRRQIMKILAKNFYEEYLSKTLLYTWINLHFDFYNNEKFKKEDFAELKDKVLILRTDNDPLMQDHGEFNKLYPNALVRTFSETGHLTDIYQFDDVVKTIKGFLTKQ